MRLCEDQIRYQHQKCSSFFVPFYELISVLYTQTDLLSSLGTLCQEVARVPDFADWTTKVRFFGVQAFAGLVCVDADTTALVVPTQQSTADVADIFALGTRHFGVYAPIQQQTSMPAIFDSGYFDFGFHDIFSVTRIIADFGFIVNTLCDSQP